MESYLHDWRQDALNKAQYESAIFVGDKLLALTGDDKDAFWLAQVHFAMGNYTRAQALLSKSNLIARNASCRYLAAHCLIKQSRFDDALAVLGERNPTHLIPSSANKRKATGSGPAGGVANVFDRAKECYKDAVRIDVQCFEAFQQLTKNALMAPDEEWEFLQSLNFDSIAVSTGSGSEADGNSDMDAAQEAADFTRMLYSTRLSKYRNPEGFATAVECLTSHYRLGGNADLLLARADLAYTQCRYEDALALTSSVLEEDRYNFGAYPLHLACLFELRMKNVLFLVAHDLADQHPEEPCSWLAVGVYYFATDRIAEARRYFSKASMMDAHYGPAWIGFAHTFAAEGEHDQAISAYSTAARLFTGTHLPQVFLGMQHHAMNNMAVAEEFLKTAYGLCREDPLLLNEMGVVCYHQDRPRDAATLFRKALEVADDMDCDPQAWLSARTNLGHAYRRMRLFREALDQFDEVLRLGGKNPAVFCAKGLIHLERGRPDEATVVLHEALAVRPQDPIATELLSTALAEMTASRHVLQLPGGNAKSRGDHAMGEVGDGDEMDNEDATEDDEDDEDDGVDAETMAGFEQELLQRRDEAQQRLAAALQNGGSSTRSRRMQTSSRSKSKGRGKGKMRSSARDDNDEEDEAELEVGEAALATNDDPFEDDSVARHRLRRTMGSNIRQKRKARSSRAVVRQSNSRKRPLNPTGNAIVAQNWDKKQTLSQNYRRLGLMNRLHNPAGGVERLGTDVEAARKQAAALAAAQQTVDLLRINGQAGLLQGGAAAVAAARSATSKAAAAGGVREVRVERDADGKIVRIVRDEAEMKTGSAVLRPIDDLLSVMENQEEWAGFGDETAVVTSSATTPVVAALEAMARQPVGPHHVRHQSQGERSWLQTLADHYGTAEPDDNTLAAMARDRRRNPMQRTAADLGRRLANFRANGGSVTA
ncbi:cell division protein [Grosmannia clavigera kw1407]|uniref:Cell division protein n=1 Tax=Grosmannia clavigera (strain kw1407 / UAMH 11150) TaxID=655863 RepID=F0XIL0_GROCL|nr:cell division protein [Grosmannia clavigera kw1407]EFX02475.1 cell division protein [Grosmannia clavigera kw1407]